jgi:purine-binding chemotaxis protein CheW
MNAFDTAPAAPDTGAVESQYLSFHVGSQLFGLPLLGVQDVLDPRPLTRIPLAPPEVAGALNVRGRIITAIDVRSRLGLPPRPDNDRYGSIVVEHEDELYNLIVDVVGDALELAASQYEPNPPTLDPAWREFADGVFRLQDGLMLVVDVRKLLAFTA